MHFDCSMNIENDRYMYTDMLLWNLCTVYIKLGSFCIILFLSDMSRLYLLYVYERSYILMRWDDVLKNNNTQTAFFTKWCKNSLALYKQYKDFIKAYLYTCTDRFRYSYCNQNALHVLNFVFFIQSLIVIHFFIHAFWLPLWYFQTLLT
jgi:hypothetical protein